jgi:hypothetical protein
MSLDSSSESTFSCGFSSCVLIHSIVFLGTVGIRAPDCCENLFPRMPIPIPAALPMPQPNSSAEEYPMNAPVSRLATMFRLSLTRLVRARASYETSTGSCRISSIREGMHMPVFSWQVCSVCLTSWH